MGSCIQYIQLYSTYSIIVDSISVEKFLQLTSDWVAILEEQVFISHSQKLSVKREMGNKAGKLVVTEEIVDTISRSSGIEAHKIRAECQNFLKDHPRGNMNRRDFRKFLKIALPKIDVKKMEDNLFRMYDTNMDGIISMEEFLIVYHIFSEGTPEENLTKEICQQLHIQETKSNRPNISTPIYNTGF